MYRFIAIALSFGLFATVSFAADDTIVRTVPTVTDLTTKDWTSKPHISLGGYLNHNDGGEGNLDIVDCTGLTIDNGRYFQDGAASPHCYERTSINGDSRQYGAVLTSEWDCGGAGLSLLVASCSDIVPRLTAMITAELPLNITHFTTGGVNVKMAQNFELPDKTCLTTDSPSLGQPTLDAVGVIWKADGVQFTMGDNACLHHYTLRPTWYAAAPYNANPLTMTNLYAARQTMADKGDTGVICDNGGCSTDWGDIVGFDNGINDSGPNMHICNMKLDANVPLWIHDTGSNTKWCTLDIGGAFDAGTTVDKYFAITNIADDGTPSHLCTVTVHKITDGFKQDGELTDLFDGATVWISKLTPLTGASGLWDRWTIHLLSSGVFTLTGSKCQLVAGSPALLYGPTFTANTTAGSERLTNVSNFAHVNENMYVLGGSVPANTRIDFFWKSDNSIYLNAPAATTATGVSFQTASDLFVTGGTDCSAKGGGQHPCVVMSAINRFFSGNSPAGVAAGHRAFGIFTGGPDPDTDKVSGLDIDSTFIFGFDVPLRAQNTIHLSVNDFGTDSVRKLGDDITGCMWIGGNYSDVQISNSGCGKAGFGILVDSGGSSDEDDSPNKGAVNFTNFHGGSFEFDGGIINSANLYGSSSFIFVKGVDQLNLNGSIKTRMIYDSAADYAIANLNLPLTRDSTQYNNIWAPSGSDLPASHISAGTGATVVGNNFFGVITAGTGTPSSLSWTMLGSVSLDGGAGAPNNWICYFQNMTAPTKRIVMATQTKDGVTANVFNASGTSGTLTAGDQITYQCGTWNS